MHNTFMCMYIHSFKVVKSLKNRVIKFSISSRLHPLCHSATPTSVLIDGDPAQTSHTSTRLHVFVIIIDGFYLVPSVLVAYREGKAFCVEAELIICVPQRGEMG